MTQNDIYYCQCGRELKLDEKKCPFCRNKIKTMWEKIGTGGVVCCVLFGIGWKIIKK